jgi:hypothetical protein
MLQIQQKYWLLNNSLFSSYHSLMMPTKIVLNAIFIPLVHDFETPLSADIPQYINAMCFLPFDEAQCASEMSLNSVKK